MSRAKSKSSPATSSTRPGLLVGAGIPDALRAEATRARPQECCGLLLGEGSRIAAALPAANVHPAPTTHFEIAPQALVDAHRAARAGGAQVIGYYHSHPAGPAEPSATDKALSPGDGRIWAIIGEAGEISFWRDAHTGFTPLAYSLCEA